MASPASSSSSCVPTFTSPLLQLHCSESKSALSALPGPPSLSSLWHYLLLCLETPRPSGKEEAIRNKIIAWAQLRGFEHAVDSVGNLRVRRPAAKGREHCPRIVLQSHLDVVCSKTNDKQHDFTKDPVLAIVEGDYLKADRTTLGADDGAGVAASMALLEDRDGDMAGVGQLEALFTVCEETDMSGAERLAQDLLASDVMISLDSEEPNCICVGCAGGFETSIHIPLVEETENTGENTQLKVFIHGLQGGHTGIDIHKGYSNALQVMARMLDVTHSEYGFRLCQFSGGNAPNAIPRDATAVLSIARSKAESFKAKLTELYENIRKEFELVENTKGIEGDARKKGWQIEFSVQSPVSNPISPDATRKCLDLMLSAPHGVLRMVPGLKEDVDLSVAFSLCSLERKDGAASFMVHLFCRGGSQDQMRSAYRRFECLARLAGGSITQVLNPFPGWAPNMKSAALKVMMDAHSKLFNSQPRIYSVHAGLECGLVQGRYPHLDINSIGPLIEGAHSPDERLFIPSVQPFYDWLRLSVINISNMKI